MATNLFFNYKEYIIGIATILISIGGSWEANSEKNSERDKDIAILKFENQMFKEQLQEQKNISKEILNTVNQINETTLELKGQLNLKADKHFIN